MSLDANGPFYEFMKKHKRLEVPEEHGRYEQFMDLLITLYDYHTIWTTAAEQLSVDRANQSDKDYWKKRQVYHESLAQQLRLILGYYNMLKAGKCDIAAIQANFMHNLPGEQIIEREYEPRTRYTGQVERVDTEECEEA